VQSGKRLPPAQAIRQVLAASPSYSDFATDRPRYGHSGTPGGVPGGSIRNLDTPQKHQRSGWQRPAAREPIATGGRTGMADTPGAGSYL